MPNSINNSEWQQQQTEIVSAGSGVFVAVRGDLACFSIDVTASSPVWKRLSADRNDVTYCLMAKTGQRRCLLAGGALFVPVQSTIAGLAGGFSMTEDFGVNYYGFPGPQHDLVWGGKYLYLVGSETWRGPRLTQFDRIT